MIKSLIHYYRVSKIDRVYMLLHHLYQRGHLFFSTTHLRWTISNLVRHPIPRYNPCGQSRLREIFLKTDNHIKGRYLAEITREVFDDAKASKYQLQVIRVTTSVTASVTASATAVGIPLGSPRIAGPKLNMFEPHYSYRGCTPN